MTIRMQMVTGCLGVPSGPLGAWLKLSNTADLFSVWMAHFWLECIKGSFSPALGSTQTTRLSRLPLLLWNLRTLKAGCGFFHSSSGPWFVRGLTCVSSMIATRVYCQLSKNCRKVAMWMFHGPTCIVDGAWGIWLRIFTPSLEASGWRIFSRKCVGRIRDVSLTKYGSCLTS